MKLLRKTLASAALGIVLMGGVARAEETVVWWDFLSGGDGVRMKAMLDEQGREIGLVGIFGNAVTHHTFSQLTEERAKAQPTAILLGSAPAAAHQLVMVPRGHRFVYCPQVLK